MYRKYAEEDVDELLAHYEHDLCDAAEKADPETLTRIAQALYLMKSGEYENIWWRIEDRAQNLAAENKLDGYHVTNLLRAFSHSQHNRQSGSDKTFALLEATVLRELSNLSDRDATHLMYAYGVRGLGSPELHKAFGQRLIDCGRKLDYPAAFNAVYYMLFREETNEAVWSQLINNVVDREETLPLIYYRPFKASKLFIEHHYPDWDLSDYADKFWHAER